MITIDPHVHWCARHLEPFRERWPQGYTRASLVLVELAIRRPDVVAACTLGDDEEASAEMLDRVLREFGPLCCLLGDEVVERWTTLALDPDLDRFRLAYIAMKEEQGGEGA